MAGKFEIYKDKAGEFRFRLKASNGEIVLSSEGYKSRKSCDNGVASVQKNSAIPERFEMKSTAGGKFRFSLKASNGQVVGTSENYSSESACKAGTQSVAKAAAGARIVDLTE